MIHTTVTQTRLLQGVLSYDACSRKVTLLGFRMAIYNYEEKEAGTNREERILLKENGLAGDRWTRGKVE